MLRLRSLAVLGVALEAACGDAGVASSSFTSGPHPMTSTASSSASDTSSSSNSGSSSSSSSSSGSDSADVSASGTSTGDTSGTSTGQVPDFGGHPIGCKGKINFLFVISSWYSMSTVQKQLQEGFPAFRMMLEQEFADFDYHIMVVDSALNALLEEKCSDCYMCNCGGCTNFGGPADYPCDEPKVDCDVTTGAGVTITGNFKAANKRCDLFGDHRYIVRGEPELAEMFACITTLGEGAKTPLPMRSLMAAIDPGMLYNGGCNDGFLRNDALLAVIVLNGEQDSLSDGTPQSWYDTLVAAKKGNEEAIVTLVFSNDLDMPEPECPGPALGPSELRLFADAAAHGHFESICVKSYVPALKDMAGTIIEQCSLLIPQ